jgi:hypothetical protein
MSFNSAYPFSKADMSGAQPRGTRPADKVSLGGLAFGSPSRLRLSSVPVFEQLGDRMVDDLGLPAEHDHLIASDARTGRSESSGPMPGTRSGAGCMPPFRALHLTALATDSHDSGPSWIGHESSSNDEPAQGRVEHHAAGGHHAAEGCESPSGAGKFVADSLHNSLQGLPGLYESDGDLFSAPLDADLVGALSAFDVEAEMLAQLPSGTSPGLQSPFGSPITRHALHGVDDMLPDKRHALIGSGLASRVTVTERTWRRMGPGQLQHSGMPFESLPLTGLDGNSQELGGVNASQELLDVSGHARGGKSSRSTASSRATARHHSDAHGSLQRQAEDRRTRLVAAEGTRTRLMATQLRAEARLTHSPAPQPTLRVDPQTPLATVAARSGPLPIVTPQSLLHRCGSRRGRPSNAERARVVERMLARAAARIAAKDRKTASNEVLSPSPAAMLSVASQEHASSSQARGSSARDPAANASTWLSRQQSLSSAGERMHGTHCIKERSEEDAVLAMVDRQQEELGTPGEAAGEQQDSDTSRRRDGHSESIQPQPSAELKAVSDSCVTQTKRSGKECKNAGAPARSKPRRACTVVARRILDTEDETDSNAPGPAGSDAPGPAGSPTLVEDAGSPQPPQKRKRGVSHTEARPAAPGQPVRRCLHVCV